MIFMGRNLCVIPARGGSKRIPRKNIKDFCGKPVIAYSIEAALASNLFDEVMVSTNDEEIANIARLYGAKLPFIRSAKNSDDFTGTGDVVYEVFNDYKATGIFFEQICCVYATAPLITSNRIKEGYDILIRSEFDVVFPVARYNSPIWRSYKMDERNAVVMNFPENEAKRTQDLQDAYFDAGQFYWLKTANLHLLPNKNSFGRSKAAIVLEDYEVQDIDNLKDWEIAEIKFKYLNYVNK
jgi:N-acylneuraminate cytidylyltransferase